MRLKTAVSEVSGRGAVVAGQVDRDDQVVPAGRIDRAGLPAEGHQRNQGSRSSLGVAGLEVAMPVVAVATVVPGGQVSAAEVLPGWPYVFWLTLSWRSKLRPPQAR